MKSTDTESVVGSCEREFHDSVKYAGGWDV